MRTSFRLPVRTLVIGLTLVLPLMAWRSISELLTLQPESKLWVEGSSTERSWSSKANDVDANVEAAPNAIAQVTAGEKGVRSVRVRVESAKMDCGNGTTNEHMLKALKAEANAVIDVTLSDYQVSKDSEGITGTLDGTLELAPDTHVRPDQGRRDRHGEVRPAAQELSTS